MKKKVSLFAALACLMSVFALVLAGCGSSQSAKTDDTAASTDTAATTTDAGYKLIKEGKLISVSDMECPPFSSYKDGTSEPEGFEIDLMAAIAERMGLESEWLPKMDFDAIIPLMGRDNPFEDDNALQKAVDFVKIVFGEDNLTENLNHIEHCLGKSLEDYLVKDFWKDHKKMYQNRPIYWLFSSKKAAFQMLVYMHRMNPYTAEKIRTKYLLPYIEFLKGKIEVDEARGADLTAVERKNLARMQAALDECIEYHDRLHGVAIKAIDFDLDDGVVVNYAKFGDVLAKIK